MSEYDVFGETNWSIAGSSGATITIGTPEIEIEVGGSYLKLTLEHKNGDNFAISGFGGGVGVGVSISIPFVNASGSLDAFPSTGLGSLMRGFASPNRDFTADDFRGNATVVSVNGGTFGKSSQLSAIFFTTKPFSECIGDCKVISTNTMKKGLYYLTYITPAGGGLRLLMNTKCYGFFLGLNVATHVAGVGLDAYQYYLTKN